MVNFTSNETNLTYITSYQPEKKHFVPNLFFLPSKVNNSNNNKKKVESI